MSISASDKLALITNILSERQQKYRDYPTVDASNLAHRQKIIECLEAIRDDYRQHLQKERLL